MQEVSWHSLPIQEVIDQQETDLEQGLSPQEAERRLREIGPNELKEQPRPGFWQHLIDQFRSFVVLLLIAAAIVSGVLGELYEAGAILLIVVLNAILGVVQEGRAERALDALKKLASPEAHVLRGGHVVKVTEREVVPGDVVLLEAGNYVPADVRVVESHNLKISESALTGESESVTKYPEAEIAEDAPLGDRRTMAYRSTTATYGRGRGVVAATGMQTEIGKIAEMIQSVGEEATPLQIRLDQLGRWLAYGALGICGVVFVIGFAYGTDVLESFLIAISLAIAAVPEGLPAIVTINLALGMREMIKRNALIRRLPAVETLGSASAICSDKTGTLTQNLMTAVRLYTPGLRLEIHGDGETAEGHFHAFDERDQLTDHVQAVDHPSVQRLLTGSLLSSDARLEEKEEEPGKYQAVGDPTEAALVMAAAKAGLWREQCEDRYPRVDEIPFDSTRKRMTTLHRDPEDEGYIAYVKGAPDVVLNLCKAMLADGKEVELTPARRTHLESVNRDMGQEALRVLAVAYRRYSYRPEMNSDEVEKDLVLVGFVGMRDPARPEVGPAIEKARHAGIRTVMVTGDYPDTARAIAREIGLLRDENGRVMSGAELDQTDDDDLASLVDEIDVFARVSPVHKVRIVEAFRKRDYVVAMTGDGVNDAPALKRASIGVAMGIAGTDVSKETADMVLTDDNYRSIVAAVEQGRIIYANIRKFVYFLLSANIAEIVAIFTATILGAGSPLSPIQLLWLNLVTDGAPALALGMEKGEPDVMERPPRPPNEPIIDFNMRTNMVVQSLVLSAVTLGAYFIGLNGAPSLGLADSGLALGRTMAFVTISVAELWLAYVSRSELYSLLGLGPFSNKFMQYAVLTSIILLGLTIYVPFLQPIFDTVPLTFEAWRIILPLTLLPPIATEVAKIGLRMRDERLRALGESPV